MDPLVLAVLLAVGQAEPAPRVEVSPNPTQYQPVTLTFAGPEASETGTINPFRDYRFMVEFSGIEDPPQRSDDYGSTLAHGYFAADGNAAETGATSGDRWRVHFLPWASGTYYYRVYFHQGPNVAVDDTGESEPVAPDGLKGSFTVGKADPRAPGFYRAGPLVRPFLSAATAPARKTYARFVEGDRPFLKAGVASLENPLAYADFDGTRILGGLQPKREGEASRAGLHRYEPHVRDWKDGDPTWRGGKGKGLIGALNYLASQGVNSVSFPTMTVEGDDGDVWPWVDEQTRDRFDVSKLDQWGIVFDHAARMGIALHVVLTETENENLFEALDGPGDGEVPFADTRKLYYRELLARFGHHPAVVWNLGEENGRDEPSGREFAQGNTTRQRKAFSECLYYTRSNFDPVVVHPSPEQCEEICKPLLGYWGIDGVLLRTGDPMQARAETLKWLDKSREAGQPWFVCVDGFGPTDTGVVPDSDPSAPANHKLAREVLWGNLLAGGSGVEWHFGYKYPHNDLNCEDFRSRERVWRFTKAAVDFLHTLPLDEMAPADDLVRAEGDAFCLAKPGEVYVVYLPSVRVPVEITLPEGDDEWEVLWFDPIEGGELKTGTFDHAVGGERSPIGEPPVGLDRDWVAVVRKRTPRP